ncbi:hypothetical protein TcCL_NonESM00054 [Trypanosoma cruzi]|uniref:Roadblock/LAMTOR2 domain-containing protein n=1 Tax=Trypanosoma cruzi (strain CL Brener) TaxID=353153 RepID=Q4D7P3_TRYCC|nr:hypothetical protein, conserved [Trypanosoma cruzi]EAN88555.1 hypothetical protein, conserved [Trypanosoma cruzi]RNC49733.1 hypothetical protein TcCL_NonESM00054 [Trypanosoma cruzi]|eukprot:XP_810406.1 hypothetical protein [Trypanosoma cruzi strain CL Brener]
MLDASFINSSLKSALGNGVEAVILLDGNGVLLSSASLNPEYVCQKEHSMIVAATGNVWRACARNDLTKNKLTNEMEPEALEQVLIDFGCRKICAMSVGGSAILCMVGTELEMGFLKLRTAALQRRLDGHLRPVLFLPS